MGSDTARTGALAEESVATYLAARGYTIVARNARVGRLEIDIIARKGPLLVFCEVRSKRRDWGYSPAETILPSKVAKVRRAAAAWLTTQPHLGTREIRFDAAAVTFNAEGQPHIDYFEEAF